MRFAQQSCKAIFSRGEALVERELSARLGVSKTPVREALKVLARSSLVTISPFRGAQVRRCTGTRPVDLRRCAFCWSLRPSDCRSPRQNKSRIAEARGILRDASTAGEQADLRALSVHNRRFHRLIYAHSGNDILTGFRRRQDQVALIVTVAWRRRPRGNKRRASTRRFSMRSRRATAKGQRNL